MPTRLAALAALPWLLSGLACDTKLVDGAELFAGVGDHPTVGTVSDKSDDKTGVTPGGAADPVAPSGATGGATGATDRGASTCDEVEGLAYLNALRGELGLGPLTRHAALDAAAQAHADYLAANWQAHTGRGLSPHREARDLSGFTGEASSDRAAAAGYDGTARGEVIAYKGSSAAAAEAWLESLYHRLPLLRRELDHVGYGEHLSGGQLTTNVLEVGRRASPPWEPSPAPVAFVVYPPDGALDVPYDWDGLEHPQPPPPPSGYPSGPVLSLSALAGQVADVVASVERLDTGAAVPATVLTAATDPYLSGRDVAIIPEAPLVPGAGYAVAVSGTLDGQPFTERWTLSTRTAGCALGEGDCSVGRGCYPMNGELLCLWEGPRGVDEVCTYVNDCQAGLTCMGSRCRPLCVPTDDASDPTWDCASVCPDAAINPYGDQADYALCPATEICGGEAGCGEDQGCYWVGESLVCGWAGDLQAGAACTYANDCASGLTCLSVNGGAGRCRALCGGPRMPPCDAACGGGRTVSLDQQAGLQACL